MPPEKILLTVHILSGFTALGVGVGAMLTQKGGNAHRLSGRIYFWAMMSVFLTAVPLALLKMNYFLFAVALLSFYSAFQGYRYVRRKNQPFTWYDKASGFMALGTGFAMLGLAIHGYITGNITMAIILTVFGLGLMTSIRDLLKMFGKRTPPDGKRDWFFAHIGSMGGSYIATFTAFAVTNLHFLPPLAQWLLPTVVGGILIRRTIQHYRTATAEKQS
jgi:uncharacterized membrane protein